MSRTAQEAYYTQQSNAQALALQQMEDADQNVDLGSFMLDAVRHVGIDMDIAAAITDGTIERVLNGASTLTVVVHDPRRILLSSLIWQYTVEVELGGLWWRLVNVAKSGDDLTMTFEDRIVAWMREKRTPLKVSRNKMTRAEFIRLMVMEIRQDNKDGTPLSFYSPQLRKKQPIASVKDRKTSSERRSTRSGGLHPSTKLKVKGQFATTDQLKVCEQVLDVGASMSANRKVLVASQMTIIDESECKNLAGGDRDSKGAFQQRKSQGWPASGNVETDAKEFFKRCIALDKSSPALSLQMLCQGVQRSGTPDGSNYKAYEKEGKAIVDEYGAGAGGSITREYAQQFSFTRGKPDGPKGENTWDAATRLAQVVQWYFFVVGYTVYYVSRDDLLKSKPVMVIDDEDDGIEQIDFDWDTGKGTNEVTITCRADKWFALPGEVVQLKAMMGPAEGRWLVSRVSRPLFTTQTTITLERPMTPKKEPAPVLASSTTQTGAIVNGVGGGLSSGASGTPKHIIDTIVLPLARKHGIPVTVQSVVDANARHGHTQGGQRSDHEGPPEFAWAADMSNGTTTPEEDKLAAELAKIFNIPWTGAGLISATHNGYRFQLIYRINTPQAGNHYNHVHFGIKSVGPHDGQLPLPLNVSKKRAGTP